ncbi:putative ribonuclease H [Helianthus debilis subsp. tardiflorus]
MEDEKDAYYVVRKGDIVGVYTSLNDCQSLLCGPDVAVFKGYRLSNVAEKYLATHGLSNAVYSVGVSNVQSDYFGQLIPCPFQKDVGSTSLPEASQRKIPETESFIEALPVSAYCCSCILEFDGAAKGNPGPAGAGVVLRAVDGSLVYRLREGLGVATNNVAEYRAMILGLRYALERGFRHIRVHGDSKLVCMQVNGLWKTKNQNMADLCKVAKELKDKFLSFQICHIEREYNSEADTQANLGVHLQNGEVQEEVDRR